jgi:hypothetical protein
MWRGLRRQPAATRDADPRRTPPLPARVQTELPQPSLACGVHHWTEKPVWDSALHLTEAVTGVLKGHPDAAVLGGKSIWDQCAPFHSHPASVCLALRSIVVEGGDECAFGIFVRACCSRLVCGRSAPRLSSCAPDGLSGVSLGSRNMLPASRARSWESEPANLANFAEFMSVFSFPEAPAAAGVVRALAHGPVWPLTPSHPCTHLLSMST